MKDLNETIKHTISEGFMRLPGNVIGNELYVAQKELTRLYESMKAGNDFDPKILNNIIKDLNSIKRQGKRFAKADDVPVSYQYKSK